MTKPYRLRVNNKIVKEFDTRQDIDDYVSQNYNDAAWHQGYLPEVEVTGQYKKPSTSFSNMLSDSVNRFKKEATSAMTLDWGNRVSNAQKHPDAMNAVQSGGNIAGGMIAGAAGLTTAPYMYNALKSIAPYLSANGWLQSTTAVGNTPAWLTPTTATAIDATLAGSTTAGAINDMRQNGPSVGNVLGTALGVGGLGVEATPTMIEGYNTVRKIITPIINLKNKNNRQAISDLFAYIKNGQYKNTFSINPETNQVSWTRELPERNVSFVQEAIKRDHPRNGRAGNFYISTDRGTIEFNPELQSTVYTSKMPEQYRGWGETYLGTVNGKTNRMVLTAPRTDQGGTNLNLPATLPKDLMKDFWITGRAITKPGTYISGDVGIYPLGQRAIQAYRESGFWPAIKTALQTENYPFRIRIGLSPDSYSSIIRQALREGSELRWGEGFYNWNSSAVENKAIDDAFNKYKKGLITLQDYKKIFNDWAVPLGGRPPQFTTTSYGRVLPVHPHPYIYIKRRGGKLCKKSKNL